MSARASYACLFLQKERSFSYQPSPSQCEDDGKEGKRKRQENRGKGIWMGGQHRQAVLEEDLHRDNRKFVPEQNGHGFFSKRRQKRFRIKRERFFLLPCDRLGKQKNSCASADRCGKIKKRIVVFIRSYADLSVQMGKKEIGR